MDNAPKNLFPSLFDPSKQARVAAVVGYLVMLLVTPAFPLAGHIYARRLGKLGVLSLVLVLPYSVLLDAVAESELPASWWWALVPLMIFQWLVPLHAMRLMQADLDRNVAEAGGEDQVAKTA